MCPAEPKKLSEIESRYKIKNKTVIRKMSEVGKVGHISAMHNNCIYLKYYL
jgi:hypothetical protein